MWSGLQVCVTAGGLEVSEGGTPRGTMVQQVRALPRCVVRLTSISTHCLCVYSVPDTACWPRLRGGPLPLPQLYSTLLPDVALHVPHGTQYVGRSEASTGSSLVHIASPCCPVFLNPNSGLGFYSFCKFPFEGQSINKSSSGVGEPVTSSQAFTTLVFPFVFIVQLPFVPPSSRLAQAPDTSANAPSHPGSTELSRLEGPQRHALVSH